jgi:hypothetical protein
LPEQRVRRASCVLDRGDVLRLITGSELPAAQKFERWVFEEVLPSIMDTGRFDAFERGAAGRGVLSAGRCNTQNTSGPTPRRPNVPPKVEAKAIVPTVGTVTLPPIRDVSGRCANLSLCPKTAAEWVAQRHSRSN